MDNFTEINSTMFDKIATFTLNSAYRINRPLAFSLFSPILKNFDKDYSEKKGIYVEDYSLEDNNITFYKWDYTTNSFEELFSLPVNHFYFSPEKGCFSFTGKYLNESYYCTMYITNEQKPF